MDNRLAYSTESGRVCLKCKQPTAKYTCKKKETAKKQSIYIFGIPLEDEKLKLFTKTLKRLCGTGGTVKDGIIVIQGDHRETLLKEIKKQGYTVKLAGG